MKTIIVKNNLENMITTNEQSPLITPMPSLYGPPNVTRTNAKLPPFTVIPNVYIATLEIVRLSDRKKLIGIRILKLHSVDPVKDGFSLTGNVYEREIPGVRTEYLNKASAFKHFFPDSIFTVWDIRDDDIQSMADNFAISLDKRKNPSKIYINAGSKVYEIKIPKPEENKETNRKGG